MISKICFAASSGGHLEEAARLAELCRDYDCFLLTESGPFCPKPFCSRAYYVPQVQRKQRLVIFRLANIALRSVRVLWKERPQCIISTGALATIPVCLLGKLMGCKLIYVESFARVDSLSATGKLLRRFADLFFVQWEQLLTQAPGAIYEGSLF